MSSPYLQSMGFAGSPMGTNPNQLYAMDAPPPGYSNIGGRMQPTPPGYTPPTNNPYDPNNTSAPSPAPDLNGGSWSRGISGGPGGGYSIGGSGPNPYGPQPWTPTDPGLNGIGYSDVTNPLNLGYSLDRSNITPLQTYGGGANFQSGQDLLGGDYVNSPETQQVLGNIGQQSDVALARDTAGASSLAAKRGILGSSTEQFGVQQAAFNNQLSLGSARNAVLLQALQQTAANRSQAAQANFGRATELGQFGQNNLNQEYNIGNTAALSDQQRYGAQSQAAASELASQRNLGESSMNRQVQQYLGEHGISVGQANANAAQTNADNANNPLNLILGGASTGIAAGLAPF